MKALTTLPTANTPSSALAVRLTVLLFLLLFQIQPATADISTNGLVLHWALDETNGYVAFDSTTNGYNGNLIGTNWPGQPGVVAPSNSQWIVDGFASNALHLNPGFTSSTPAPTRVEVTGVTQFTNKSTTWGLWVRLGPTNVGFQNVLASPTGVGAGNNLGFDTGGLIPRVLWNNGGTPNATIQSAAGPIPTNVWTHLAVTYDGATSNLVLYVNGGVQASSTASAIRSFSSIELGTRGNFQFAFQGDVDDVYIYNRALSASEVAALAGFSSGPPQITTQPANSVFWEGSPASLSVAASGIPPLAYQWYKNSQLVNGATNSVYQISAAAQQTNAGAYFVVVSNAIGPIQSVTAQVAIRPTNALPANIPSWVPTNGLVMYWTLDQSTNFTAFDYSGNGNNGGLVAFPFDGSQQVSGFISNSVNFNTTTGVGQQIVVSNLPPLSNLTWAAWVNATPNDFNSVLSATFPGAANGHNLGFSSGVFNAHPRLLWNNGVASTTVQSPEAVPDNDWSHLAMTYDVASTTLTLYVNGKQDGKSQVATTTAFRTMAAGIRLPTQAQPYKGKIDEVLVYDHALTQTEIQSLAQNSGAHGQALFRNQQLLINSFQQSNNVSYLTVRSLWTNGTPGLYGATNVSGPWQLLSGAQYTVLTNQFLNMVWTNTNSISPLFFRASVTPPAPLFSDNFESGAAGWTHGGQNDSWALGTPTIGPGAAYSGANVYSTGLTSDYNTPTDCYLHSPTINLAGLSKATLRYREWTDIYPNIQFHFGQVNILDANTQTPLATGVWQVGGNSGGWIQRDITLHPTAYTNSNVVVEFRTVADPFDPFPGWYLDDVLMLPY